MVHLTKDKVFLRHQQILCDYDIVKNVKVVTVLFVLQWN
jgi:hypothetical protein